MNREEWSLFETSWAQLGEVALSCLLIYLAIVVIVRLNGPRTTAQLNSFDWIINVMVGSLAASGVLLEDVSILTAGFAIVCLAFLQFVLTWTTERSSLASDVVKARPMLLTHKGEYLEEAMRSARVSKAEIETALRENGHWSVHDANWVILETNGKLTVLPRDDAQTVSNTEVLQKVRTGSQ